MLTAGNVCNTRMGQRATILPGFVIQRDRTNVTYYSPILPQSSYVLVAGNVCNIIGSYMKYSLDYVTYLPDTNTYIMSGPT